MRKRGTRLNRNAARTASRWLCGVALSLAAGAAMALGLGEIRVKSAPGQPLLAEIPIISSDPAEMEQLQARLASPVTFERVGLPRPQGLVNELDFRIALSDDGRPVIRVTSAAPVQQDVVNFLVEVDWGQGRLVREYAALVNAPGTVAAVSEPAIDTPVAVPSDTIVREPEPLPPAPVESPPAEEIAQAPPEPATDPATPEPPPARPAPAASAPLRPGDMLGTVRRGQTLSQIARDLGAGASLDQTMLALLRANPDAFINGNINLLKQGAVLRMPASAELTQLSRAEASALVGQQMAEWRQARRPVAQPVAADMPTTASTVAPDGSAAADARLEIAPAAADAAQRAGTTSGLQAGGEGDMLDNAQTPQVREELASTQAEVAELRTRLDELEKIRQQQEKLIALKDSDLAAAQQKLGQAPGSESPVPWIVGGLALLVAGLFAGWLVGRRRAAAPPAPRKSPLSNAWAATVEKDSVPEPVAPELVKETAAKSEPEPETSPVAPPVTYFDVRQRYVREQSEAPRAAAPVPFHPTWHADDPALNVGLTNPATAGRERLELAIAYLDLGDTTTARSLLNEVLAGNDPQARTEAMRLLRDIG